MTFTDLYIKRPVLASVISLLILLLGVQAFQNLSIRQYPEIENSLITITTAYPGANADIIQGFITTPVQQAIASAEGIDYVTSSSQQSRSTVSAYIKLGYSANDALSEIQAKVAEVQNELPSEAEKPVISKSSARGSALMYISFFSEEMSNEQVTDYLARVVQPKLSTIDGVAEAELLGEKIFAMRIWLNPTRMAAYNVTAKEVRDAIRQNNFLTAAGETKGAYVATAVNALTDLKDSESFSNIVIKNQGDTLIRMRDIARVELNAENFDSYVAFNGISSVYFGITSTPSANPLEVIDRVRDRFPAITAQLPSGLQGRIVYDATEFIQASIDEVVKTLAEASLIVIFVVFFFLGSIRSVIIPVITIPLSIVGVLFFMLAMGYSINLLTLLAMVLAVGLVVDDAIVVVENIHRHLEEGLSPFDASIKGAREIALPVISMTITLAAVYAPIGFMGGLTGKLFSEFAFTLAGAVLISGVIALTLSPMMCAKLLRHDSNSSGLAHRLDVLFEKLRQGYHRQLHSVLNYRPVTLLMTLAVLLSIPFLYLFTKSELAPTEDQSIIFISAKAPKYANLDYLNRYTEDYQAIFEKFPEFSHSFLINGSGSVQQSIAGMALKPWDQRQRTQMELQPLVQKELSKIPGLQIFSFNMPSLPGAGGGMPIQFVVNTTADYQTLYQVSERLTQEARKSGLFMFVSNELRFDKPETQVLIDRDKAAQLGINMQDIGEAFSLLLGEARVNRFFLEGRSYKVIPQAERDMRNSRDWLEHYYVNTESGQKIPLSTLIRVESTTRPGQLNQFQQLNSSLVQGVMAPGVTIGDALEFLNEKSKELFPEGFSSDYSGLSRQYVEEGNKLFYTFLLSLMVIFLVLAAQFESFRDPLVILITVPLSICGAMIPLALDFATFNIYTQVGLVTLIGLISKHGILIVEFANKLQQQRGLSPREAVEEAASIRLRAVLMTTFAMVLGVVPLLLATGAGAVSRFDIGLVLATGMTIGTCFTLYVVPTIYTLLAARHARA
ncbi:MexW/MexI family multidrug efflux RND transporter permease subunit [Aestuariirhabdus litorea]|uniref:MexW/MexI family multidrug efflux RND transporter permease subunit n=1 Tax=Aestuariirhabdus litorea TaxID=2528527 RepID=A0A3P3VPK1_9GAMM|nr:MexW/MexI family multidrug efflux RND transporter permease subunit [Aestuariirhabdus litorea]RRJ84645.1 MexW/MexI family multidrug efflux RND transporter permease subunit [Aestuariirhabdus litorea]RWW97870.1 MexW/MexI family multidrug efflux RND transporter permease subunit [Endozoicomonadaceae bacterium GTF-13]